MDARTRQLVRERAALRCEYCQLAEIHSPVARLQVEHIRPKKHGGDDDPQNLALACIDCNLHKGPNLTGIDPITNQIVAIFNPRNQRWADHFRWNGIRIEGITDVGRTTVTVMDFNSQDQLQVRMAVHNS
jgi:5-methylcytosine-specific restriction endonuclease McrA